MIAMRYPPLGLPFTDRFPEILPRKRPGDSSTDSVSSMNSDMGTPFVSVVAASDSRQCSGSTLPLSG